MRIESTDIFRNTAVLEQVEEQLQETDIPLEIISDISETLEGLDKKVSNLSTDDFKKRIQTAKKTLVDREISVILSSAKELEVSVLNNDLTRIASKVNALKNSLKSFEKRHGTEYGFVKEAKAFIECADKMTAKKGASKVLKEKLERAYEKLTETLSERLRKEIPPEEAELIFDLFDLAEAVHNHKQGIEGKLEDLKSRLKSKNQVAKIDRSLGNEEKLKTVLLEVGHELAGKPFEGDTKEWFKELDQYADTPSFVHQNSTIRA